MNIIRTSPIPAIYTHLPFVRYRGPCILADLPEDLPLLQQLQGVAAGHACVSVLESPHELFVQASFPDDILSRSGETDDVIEWQCCCWTLWDAESLITSSQPVEAVDPTSVGIDPFLLESLAHPTSCIPLLQKTVQHFPKGFTLTADRKASIEAAEQPIIAGLELTAMKQLKVIAKRGQRRRTATANDPPVSKTLRMDIMRRDKRCCVFCGKSPPEVEIEVDHIIPRSLINKLHLDQGLHTSPDNLCVMCFDDNRGKRDHLAKEDIASYIKAFSAPTHPNNPIVKHLEAIGELQAL